jgi:hypothetical protein
MDEGFMPEDEKRLLWAFLCWVSAAYCFISIPYIFYRLYCAHHATYPSLGEVVVYWVGSVVLGLLGVCLILIGRHVRRTGELENPLTETDSAENNDGKTP